MTFQVKLQPARVWTRKTRRVLGYHEVSRVPSKDVYELTPASLAAHMELAQHAAMLAGHTFEVTFDDGHCSHTECVAPLLEERGMRGIFFVPTDRVGVKRDTATWPELRRLAASGHVIGSHGHTHTFLTQCTWSKLEQEVNHSRALLQDRMGQAVNAISMPGGRWNHSVAEACRQAGYQELFTSEPYGTSAFRSEQAGTPLTIVGRLVVRRTIAAQTIAKYAAGDLPIALWFQAEYLAKQAMKRVVGDSVYQAAWQRLLRKIPHGASL